MISLEHMVNDTQIFKHPSIKTQILLAHTSSTIGDYFTKISTRCDGTYDSSFTFSIDLNGQVYRHYNPLHYSNIFGIQDVDSQIISIGLENVGWLTCKSPDGDFFDWKGCIYKGRVHNQLWRGYDLWAVYTTAQIESMCQLIGSLVKEYNIKTVFSGNNLPLDNAKDFKGVLNRANYNRVYHDLSPAADFDLITKLINKI